jgi:DNA helicase HerA-like ATPase
METLLRYAHELLQKELLSARNRRGYFDVDDLLQEIDRAAEALGLQGHRAQTVAPTKLRTETLKRHRYLGAPYDWRRALTPGAFVNIDCRGLLISDLRLIVASIARDLQNLARAKQIPFVAFSIDEFHLVAPATDGTVTTQVLRELARIGRHYRLGLILTTQSPQDVDRSILKRCLTRFLHAIEPDQLDALRGVFSDASPELVRQLPKLPQGVCVLTGARETVRHAAVIRIRARRTTHGGDTPDIFGDLRDRGWPGKECLPEGKGARDTLAGEDAIP